MRNSLIKVCSANFVYCFVSKVVLTAYNPRRDNHSGMVVPRHSQVADLLPGFPGWVPREHRGEVVVAVPTASHVEDVSDHGGS